MLKALNLKEKDSIQFMEGCFSLAYSLGLFIMATVLIIYYKQIAEV